MPDRFSVLVSVAVFIFSSPVSARYLLPIVPPVGLEPSPSYGRGAVLLSLEFYSFIILGSIIDRVEFSPHSLEGCNLAEDLEPFLRLNRCSLESVFEGCNAIL